MESLPSEYPLRKSTKGCDCEGRDAGGAGDGAQGEDGVVDPGPGWPPPASAHAWATVCNVPSLGAYL